MMVITTEIDRGQSRQRRPRPVEIEEIEYDAGVFDGYDSTGFMGESMPLPGGRGGDGFGVRTILMEDSLQMSL